MGTNGNKLPSDESIRLAAEMLDIMGDPTRAGILCALMGGEMCVADIAALLDMTASAISHQLRVLKQARMVSGRREGKSIFYSLADEHIEIIFKMALEHAAEERGTE